MLCLLTNDNNNKPKHNTTTYCVYWLTTMYDKPNNNATTYCVYWRMTTKTNPTIIRTHIVFIDWQIQPYYDHMLCLLTDDNNDKPNLHTSIYCFTDGRQQRQIQPYYDHMLCLLTDDNNDKTIQNTSTYCVYWGTTTMTIPTLLRPHIVFTDWR
jgi:hypothetical protein